MFVSLIIQHIKQKSMGKLIFFIFFLQSFIGGQHFLQFTYKYEGKEERPAHFPAKKPDGEPGYAA